MLLLVPARGGSKGIPGKNLQETDGVSLVGRAVISARRFLRETGLPDARVVVDTDMPAIETEARRWGAEVPFLRPENLAQDSTTTLASTLHLVDRLAESGWQPDTIVLLQPTSPLRSWNDIADCWSIFANSDRESVITVVEPGKPPQLAMRTDDDAVLNWLGEPPPANVRRQDLSHSVSPSGAVYITTVKALRERRAFVVPGVTVGVERCSVRSLDIDTPADLVAARRAAVLAAPEAPTQVRTASELPVAGGVVTLNDGMVLRVCNAAALPQAMNEEAVTGFVLLIPGSGSSHDGSLRSGGSTSHEIAPGAGSWREALGGRVALWCSAAEQLASHAVALGGYDLVVLPHDQPDLAALAGAMLKGSTLLRS